MNTDLGEFTLEEKAALTSGADFWTTKAIDRLGVPSIMLTDGPHGLRKQAEESDHLGLAASVPATCFPPAVALASSWDAALAERVGAAIAVEAAIEDVAVVLGPGVNIKRSPLCGRNFEYMSEDPVLSGIIGAGLVRGIQSQGVGASLKHFAANNQETDRLRSSSDVDPRPLREIYLRAFQHIVTQAQPWTVMCSYNRLNGVYTSEDPWLLTAVLRDEWGFEGLVVSDWGAVNDRVAGLPAGLDLEMPSSNGRTEAELVAAVRDGRLDEAYLDTAAGRVLDLVRKAGQRPAVTGPLDVEAHHALARKAAGRSMVLLKNEGSILPLSREASVAVIGEFARTPRYQGAGSSQIIATRLDNALAAIRDQATGEVSFAPGYLLNGSGDADALLAEAVATAAAADTAVLFIGVPAEDESEGFDRTHIDLPTGHLALVDAVLAANPRTCVVLSNGGVVALPFADRVPAILEGWLLGQASGSATADILFGAVNPGGKLAETIPLRLQDTPAYSNFPGAFSHVRYGEGILVGYRWYDARELEVAFPFGHGLSYTTFDYGTATGEVDENGDLRVRLTVTNSGDVAGREVIQAYTSLTPSAVERAPRELKAFAVVDLQPGETREIELTIRREDLAYWDIRMDRWMVEGGDYEVAIGASSRDLRATVTIAVAGDETDLPLTMGSTIDEVLAHPSAGPVLREAIGTKFDPHFLRLIGPNPVGRLDGLPLPRPEMERIIAEAAS